MFQYAKFVLNMVNSPEFKLLRAFCTRAHYLKMATSTCIVVLLLKPLLFIPLMNYMRLLFPLVHYFLSNLLTFRMYVGCENSKFLDPFSML
jgi:hypothetical protein